MSTRGVIGFRLNGVDKLTYNHSDSYPSYMLVKLLKEIKDNGALFFDIERLKKIVNGIKLVSEGKNATVVQMKKLDKWCKDKQVVLNDFGVGDNGSKEWYCLLRKAQGSFVSYFNGLPYMLDSIDYTHDSLGCEWGYVLNLDDMTLEIYEGCNKVKGNRGRYDVVCSDKYGYCGIAFICAIDLKYVYDMDKETVDKIVGVLDSHVSYGLKEKEINAVLKGLFA